MLEFLMCTILKMAAVDCPDTETNLYQTQARTVNLRIIVLLLTQNKPVEPPAMRTTAIRFITDEKSLYHPRNVTRSSLLPMGSGGSLPQYSSSNMNLTIYLRLMEMVTNEIGKFAMKHEERLVHHVNVEAIQLLDNSELVRRL